ncbi:hypothetical protein TUN199_06397 [Pyrenophora tritici-repentis]|uniref:F-box domain-containing protein n=2 Tax=Pyrenophora tritici-repentis TaxID=45151 RepID=A0A922N7A0_9PLEO|nr:hypothetical protein Alg215_08596 [Pyrenophora tritici-repentis]KAI0578975.1 hypothetical protein Alg130_07698 [Pyrenophora tritici-repentis]KAI0608014.1 hypothetical protein TUN205_07731 [Pyrenophora tritici-repentis]KAI0621599.1 hypothetical protein TUN199_06397 [Pyrenophora tritici-repentis]KAI1509655.1 hypothetical protein Ptr86124_011241 [Pyrenophora tritici-repentis]
MAPTPESHRVARSPNKTIEDLPEELLLEIVRLLGCMPACDYHKFLHGLCLVKPFNPVATQMLYGGQVLHVTNHPLLRTVLEKPKLAALIRRVHLTKEFTSRLLEYYHDSEKEETMADLEQADLFRRAIVPENFPNLRTVHISGNVLMIQVASIMRLPALQQLRIKHLDNYGSREDSFVPGWTPDMFQSASTNIVSLEITEGPVQEDAFATLIRACTALEFFCYGNAVDADDIDDLSIRYTFSMTEVWEALRMHRSTLHSLAFFLIGYSCTPFRSLVEFTALEKLCIDAKALSYDTRMTTSSFRSRLPPGIKFLRVIGKTRTYYEFTTLLQTIGSFGGEMRYLIFPLDEDHEPETYDKDLHDSEHLGNHWRNSVDSSGFGWFEDASHFTTCVWDWEVPGMPV